MLLEQFHGYRSGVAASLPARSGRAAVASVLGGMRAKDAAGPTA